ncbi:transportin-1-like [Carex rostrata]
MLHSKSWTEESMNMVFLDILKALKDSNMEKKSMALSYINQYMGDAKSVASSGTQESFSLFKTNIVEVIDAILCIQESLNKNHEIQASKFWFNYFSGNWPLENLDIFISRIVKILLVSLPYVEDDDALSNVHLSEVENSFPYNEECPLFLTLREYSAYCLSKLATAFGNKIIEPLVPLIERNIMDTNCAYWKKESAILALGIVSEYCKDGLGPHLSELAPALMPLSDHPFPLVTKTTEWTISRHPYLISLIQFL